MIISDRGFLQRKTTEKEQEQTGMKYFDMECTWQLKHKSCGTQCLHFKVKETPILGFAGQTVEGCNITQAVLLCSPQIVEIILE